MDIAAKIRKVHPPFSFRMQTYERKPGLATLIYIHYYAREKIKLFFFSDVVVGCLFLVFRLNDSTEYACFFLVSCKAPIAV